MREPTTIRSEGARAAPARAGRRYAAGARAGLTLMEMVLVLVLLAMIAGLVVINVAGWHEGRKLDEGALQFEMMIRLARADSATVGRRLRLSADEDTREVDVTWEYEPLTKPGEFTPYRKASWTTQLPNDLVRVRRMELTGPSAFRTLSVEQMLDPDRRQAEQELAPITFYPDGSSDSAEVLLSAAADHSGGGEFADGPDVWVAVIDLDGLNGLIDTRVLTMEEYDNASEASEQEHED